ncbi:asialoglycoprotein receptor 1-like isoform X2 [Pseudochaenichthys georgianus]|uniref:asialoglycoprotein receptor 1-like isoform X2 n=1 Tax=Pseudochaenichthys georgianus TaxID=52239 RepID=UPI00146E25EB|nr:asialoglycoprotein receptor 1-like isoform X2 [Pseudochaenichthys georgianus]
MDLMEIDDDVYIDRHRSMEGLVTKVDFQRKKQPSRCASVCLGLLCAVLLAGNIGQLIYYEVFSHPASGDPMQSGYVQDRPQSSDNNSSAERKQLETTLTNLTTEKDQLHQSYDSVTAERDELKVSFNKVGNETDMLRAATEQLQSNYSDLQREKEELQTEFSTLRANRDQLQSTYTSLKTNHDQTQFSYSSVTAERDEFKASFNKLQTEKDQLQKEHSQLETDHSVLRREKGELQKKIDKIRARPCQTGWSKFDISCYFVSLVSKNWTLSRQECIEEGADLVVIDSLEEQAFLNMLMHKGQNVWIGLTDSLQEGTWMWVDGSNVTTKFWQPGQPNSYNGNQDCGENLQKTPGVGEWNDDGCFAVQNWICEK